MLDINILLDLFLFSDPQVAALRSGLEAGALSFLSTAEMREEQRRVLDYPYLQPLMAFHGLTPDQVWTPLMRRSRSARWPRRRRLPARTPTTISRSTWQPRRAQACSAMT